MKESPHREQLKGGITVKSKKKHNKFFEMKASADGKTGDVFLYGEITKYAWEDEGEHSAQTFKNELDSLGGVETINLYCNSPAGSVFEGITIHNMLKPHNALVIAHVDALAASIESVIIMTDVGIIIPNKSMLMIHNQWYIDICNADNLHNLSGYIEIICTSAYKYK